MTRSGESATGAGRPRVSIAMPCYQQAPFIERAVRSVFASAQADHVELIVQDPGSTDGSRTRLERLRDEFGDHRVRLCFEADQGQSDAVNRALARARGDVLGWLNSDDRLRPGAIDLVWQRLGEAAVAGRPAWLYGRAGMIDANDAPVSSWIARYKAWRGRRFSRSRLLTENFIPQMAVFWTRALQGAVGTLRTDKHLDMDYDLWLRFAAHAEPAVVDATLADFRVHARAKGSRQTGEQLAAAFVTAREHAADAGWRGRCALLLHRAFAVRTRLCYALIKPRAEESR